MHCFKQEPQFFGFLLWSPLFHRKGQKVIRVRFSPGGLMSLLGFNHRDCHHFITVFPITNYMRWSVKGTLSTGMANTRFYAWGHIPVCIELLMAHISYSACLRCTLSPVCDRRDSPTVSHDSSGCCPHCETNCCVDGRINIHYSVYWNNFPFAVGELVSLTFL